MGQNQLRVDIMPFFLMVIFALHIHEHNIIHGMVQRKFKKRFQFQFYKKHYILCYWVAMKEGVGVLRK